MWTTTINCSNPDCEHQKIEVPQPGHLPHENWVIVRRMVMKLNPKGKAPRKAELIAPYCSLRCALLHLDEFEARVKVEDAAAHFAKVHKVEDLASSS